MTPNPGKREMSEDKWQCRVCGGTNGHWEACHGEAELILQLDQQKAAIERLQDDILGEQAVSRWRFLEMKKLEQANRELRESIKKSIVRFEILLGRARGCDEDNNTKKHGVSEIEIPGWIQENKDLLTRHSESGERGE